MGGPFWNNGDVDSNSNCGSGNINGQWFYGQTNARKGLRKGDMRGLKLNEEQLLHLQLVADNDDEYDGSDGSDNGAGEYSDPDGETECDHRSSLETSRQMMQDLKAANPDTPRKELVHEWAVEMCKYEQGKTEAGLCDQNTRYAWDDCSNRDRWPLNPRTNDITISRTQMTGDPNLTECQKDSRKRMWQWAREMNQLQYLCMGCFDPFCDRTFLEGKCPLDANTHYDRNAIADSKLSFVESLYAGQLQAPQLDRNVVLLMAAALLMTLLVVNRWCAAGKAKQVEEARYGAV